MVFRQLLQDLHEARQCASSAHELVKEGKSREADTLYVSAVLQSHRVMQEYMDTEFKRHPKVYPRLVETLLMSGTPRSALDGLTTSVRAATTASGANTTAIDEMVLGQERLLTRINLVATGANVTLPAGNGVVGRRRRGGGGGAHNP